MSIDRKEIATLAEQYLEHLQQKAQHLQEVLNDIRTFIQHDFLRLQKISSDESMVRSERV